MWELDGSVPAIPHVAYRNGVPIQIADMDTVRYLLALHLGYCYLFEASGTPCPDGRGRCRDISNGTFGELSVNHSEQKPIGDVRQDNAGFEVV